LSYIEDFIDDEALCIKDSQICSSAGRALTLPKLYEKFKKGVTSGDEFLDQKTFKQEVKRLAPERTARTVVFQLATVENERELVDQALTHLRIKVNATGEEITMDRRNIPASKLDSLLAGHVVDYNNQSQTLDNNKMHKFRRTFNIADIKAVYFSTITVRENENRNELAITVAYDKKYKDYAHEKLTKIFSLMRPEGDTKWDLDFHVLMFKQWMWQVKQHISPLYVGNTLTKTVLDYYLVNLASASGEGAGKTTFIRKLCAPISDYYHEGSLESVASSSDYSIFASNYIVLFDELAFGKIPASERGKVMTSLKYILTAEKMFNRVYHTQTFQRMLRQFSGISTSNGSLTNMIYDPSGMRRFYEIPVNPNRNTERYKHINNMESLKIWKGIDENDRKGYIKTDSKEFYKLQKIQKSYIKKDALDIYLDATLESDQLGMFTVAEAEKEGYIAKFSAFNKTGKQEAMADKIGIDVLTIHDFRENLLGFYADDMDEKRWLQKREGLRDSLKAKGYWVITYNNAILIPTRKYGAR